jgi:2-polyprenyl-3-methyl-5-hydroxy-6-metoxy-1,4-benzoquinol methylase
MRTASEWRGLEPRDAVLRFVGCLGEELASRRAAGLDASYLALKYEGTLLRPGDGLNLLGVEGYAARLAPLVEAIRAFERPKFIDAGCGCGSEAILAALLGADVAAVDIVGMRVDYARSRVPFYAASRPLGLRFVRANVLAYLEENPGVDVVWANESVSHIHPVESFLRGVRAALNPGGVLLVADSNALNPAVRSRAARIRGSREWFLRRRFPCLDDGGHDEVADERVFTVGAMKRMLRAAGFRVRRVEMLGFLGSSFFPGSWQTNRALVAGMTASQAVLKRIPLVRLAGSAVVFVAGRDDERRPS